MKLNSEDLISSDYILLDKMDHLELMPFVKEFLKKRTVSALVYYSSNIVLFWLLLFFFIRYYRSGHSTISGGLIHFSIGIAIVFALIPLHEFIHILAYKSQGARQTSYDVNLKKFYFLAVADKFVANKQEFKIIALSPFIVISLLLGILLLFAGQLWTITILTALMIHCALCSGDFALLSYFEFNKDKEVVTYDDKENKVSLFYARKKQSKTIA